MRQMLNYEPRVSFAQGLTLAVQGFQAETLAHHP